MRIYLNKHLRELPDCFSIYRSHTYMEFLCPSCQTEICCHWVFPKPHHESSPNGRYSFYLQSKTYSDYLYCRFDYGKHSLHCDYTMINDPKYCQWLREAEMHTRFIPAAEIEKQIQFLQQIHVEEEKARAEYRKYTQEAECPICHTPLMPYRDYYHFFSGIKLYGPVHVTQEEHDTFYVPHEKVHTDKQRHEFNFEFLNFRLKNQDKETAQKRYYELYSQYDVTIPSEERASANIKSDLEKLKKYLLHLFTLETNIYSISKHLLELYELQCTHNRNVFRQKAIVQNTIREKAADDQLQYDQCMAALQRALSSKPESVYVEKPQKPNQPTSPILVKPGFFHKKKNLAYNAELTAKYEQECRQFEIDLARYHAELEACAEKEVLLIREAEEKHNQAIAAAKDAAEKAKTQLEQSSTDIEAQIEIACALPAPETVTKKFVDDEIAQAEKLLKDLIECRNKLYAHDVVFGKYRNLVALATFYEYLVSGRCSSLEGPNGAYNLFEMECRANQIIGQLTKIVDSLEEIKATQYLVYSQLKSINSSLDTMNSTMSNMAKSINDIKADTHDIKSNTQSINEYMKTVAQNSEVIAHTTAVNAYYSKMNAELTNSLGYLIALH